MFVRTFERRRLAKPIPPMPRSNIAQVAWLRDRAPDCDGRNRQGSISEERIDQFKRSREEARIAGIAGKQGRGIELGEPEVGSGNAQAGEYSVAETDRRRFAGDAAKRAVDIIESD